MWYVLGFSVLAGVVGTLLGAALLLLIKKQQPAFLSAIMSFAGGFMLAMVCFDMLPEAISHAGMWIVLPCAAAGVAVIWALGLWIEKPLRNRCQTTQENASQASLRTAGMLLIVAISLHNLPEGMAIGSLGEMHKELTFAVLIGVHNIPEGMAICAMLRQGGASRTAALSCSALAGVPTVIGALAGYWISSISPIFMGVCMALAAGAMLYIVFQDMLAEAYAQTSKNTVAVSAIFGLLLGVGIISLIAH